MRNRGAILFGLSLLVPLLAAAAVWICLGLQDLRLKTRIFDKVDDLPKRPYAIILGAKVEGNNPSPMLEDRLQTALELIQSQRAEKLLLSGGPSRNGPHEVRLMREWLERHGVPSQTIVEDMEGLTTRASLTNARDQFGVTRTVIVTQRFHLPRALFLSEEIGLDAIGVSADHRVYEEATYHQLREFFARIKAYYQTFASWPRYLSILRDTLFPLLEKESAIAAGRERITQKLSENGFTTLPADVMLVYFKKKRTLDVFLKDEKDAGSSAWKFFQSYPVLAASGTWGPKLREGDRQVPEGIYRVSFLNQRSRFHLSLRLDYPNAFDQQKGIEDGRDSLGNDIMIHGNSVSIGCLAIGDAAIEELFALATDADYRRWQVVLAPFDPREKPEVTLPTGGDFPVWYPELLNLIKNKIEELPK